MRWKAWVYDDKKNITNKNSFKNDSSQIIPDLMNKNQKLSLDISFPSAYRKIIEKCSETNPKNRPSFDEIVRMMQTKSEFITPSVDKDEYMNYIQRCNESF